MAVQMIPRFHGRKATRRAGMLARVVAVLFVLLALVPGPEAMAYRASGLAGVMPTVGDLGRTQTLGVESEGALSLDVVAERLYGLEDAWSQLSQWGWTDGYERTFVSNDALPNDAHLVQITMHRFSSPPGAAVMRYFATARLLWTQVAEQAPHAEHLDWLKLAGPSDTGREVTYYAVEGDVLVRVITVAANDPAADATDIMGRVLKKVRGEAIRGNAPKPAAPEPSGQSQGSVDEAAVGGMAAMAFAQVDGFWESMGYAWYVSPDMDLFEAPDTTGCGYIAVDPGPFYCLLDGTIYLNEPVVEMLAEYDADFLLGLFVAHEWGHHITRLAGYDSAAVPIFDGQVWSVQAELAADCLAGVWAYGEQQAGRASPQELLLALGVMFELGDAVGSPLSAPDSHGTGDMRVGAFSIGLDSGDPGECQRRILDLE
jgi:predicted metalloprotease